MTDAATAICNLLYRYAEAIDAGDFSAATRLFASARVRFAHFDTESFGGETLLEHFKKSVRIYDDGTPRTKHIITNPILDIDEMAGVAKCRSYYTVIQGIPGEPAKVVSAGRYRDEFTRSGDEWHFSYREYLMPDLMGDRSGHVLLPGDKADPQ